MAKLQFYIIFCTQKTTLDKRPVWFVFAGMGTQWHGMGRKMMENELFKQSIMKSDDVLKPYNINLYDMLMEGEEATFEKTVNSFVGIAAIQVDLSNNYISIGWCLIKIGYEFWW